MKVFVPLSDEELYSQHLKRRVLVPYAPELHRYAVLRRLENRLRGVPQGGRRDAKD